MRTITTLVATTVLAAGCASGGGGGGGNLPDGLLCVISGPLCPLALAPKTPAPQAASASNVRTQTEYATVDGIIRPQAQVGGADGPFLGGEVQVRYDDAGRLAFFDPGGFGAQSAHARYANLEAAGLPWLEAGSAHDVLVANSRSLGWSYQSFGAWNTTHPGGGVLHASSFGAPTPASAVPASGTATFTGKLAGFYVSPSGEAAVAAADLAVRADFQARSLAFASSRTVTTRDFRTTLPAPALNLSGTLAYQPGSSAFSGTLRSAAGTLSGATSGKFHGPAAHELGGVFNLRAPGTPEAFTGAYGAKR